MNNSWSASKKVEGIKSDSHLGKKINKQTTEKFSAYCRKFIFCLRQKSLQLRWKDLKLFFFSRQQIVYCVAATTCSGQGTCGDDGLCQCDAGLTGADCTEGKLAD